MIAALAGLAFGAVPVWELDLSSEDGGLVSGGQTGQWEWALAPGAGPVGQGSCWGTNPDGVYLHETTDWLEISLPDPLGVTEPTLVLRHWYAIEQGDTAIVEVDSGSGAGFVRAEPLYGYPHPDGFVGQSGGYVDAVYDLRGLGPAPRVRLVLSTDPAQAAAGWYLQRATLWDGDVFAPVVVPTSLPEDTQDLDGPYTVRVDATDDRGVIGATLWMEGSGDPVEIPMQRGAGDAWSAELPGQIPGTTVSYWIEVSDGTNVGRWPPLGSASFRVFLAAPTGLAGPDELHIVATEVPLAWEAPVTPHPVLGYQVFREGAEAPVAEVGTTSATVPIADPQRYWVEALYAQGPGDPSEPVSLSVELPRLLDLSPSAAFQGEQLYVHLSGSSLYLLSDDSVLSLGPDANVLSLDVRDANAATALVELAPDAAVGPVDVTVEGTAGRFTFAERFEILDGAGVPRIERTEPSQIGQGETIEVEISATVPFASTPTVSVDGDLLITDVALDPADPRIARFGLAASGFARLGPHSLGVDDGERLYTTHVRVEETFDLLDQGCRGCVSPAGPRPGGATLAGLLCGLLALGARRRAPQVPPRGHGSS